MFQRSLEEVEVSLEDAGDSEAREVSDEEDHRRLSKTAILADSSLLSTVSGDWKGLTRIILSLT